MAKIKVTLTDDHIALIKNFRFNKLKAQTTTPWEDEDRYYGVDTYGIYGGTFLFEDMAIILGKQDKMIPGTQEDVDGPKYDEDTTKYLKELDEYICMHIQDILEITHQFCITGLKPGTYTCLDYVRIWSYGDTKKKKK